MKFDEPRTVVVDRGCRGGWEVAPSDGRAPVACETLDDALRVAHHHAEQRYPCELIVRDAYHRVIDHALIARDLLGAGAPAGRR